MRYFLDKMRRLIIQLHAFKAGRRGLDVGMLGAGPARGRPNNIANGGAEAGRECITANTETTSFRG